MNLLHPAAGKDRKGLSKVANPLESLGLFYYKPSTEKIVYGDVILARELAANIIGSGLFEKYLLYSVPSKVEPHRSTFGHKIESHHEGNNIFHLELCESWNKLAINQPSIFFELWRHEYGTGFHLRKRRGGVMRPVTIFCHGPYVHWTYLFPLVVSGSYQFDSIICHSKACRAATEKLIDSHAEKMSRLLGVRLQRNVRVDMIPVGVDLARFAPRSSAEARAKYGLNLGATIILIMGRVSRRSKADLLPLLTVLRALTTKYRGEQLQYVFAGSSDEGYADTVKEISCHLDFPDNACVFIENVRPAEREMIYNAADIFVSLADNIQESFGLTPLEALASGVPQVVSDWNGYRDTVVHGRTGFLVPTVMPEQDDDDALDESLQFMMDQDNFRLCENLSQKTIVDLAEVFSALDALVGNRELRRNMARASRRRAETTRSWDATLQQFGELWHELYSISQDANVTSSAADSADSIAQRYSAEVYDNHPSRLAKSNDIVAADGFNTAKWNSLLPIFASSARDFINPAIASMIKCKLGDNRIPFEELVAEVTVETKAPQSTVRAHVMWLAKYGFLTTKPYQSLAEGAAGSRATS